MESIFQIIILIILIAAYIIFLLKVGKEIEGNKKLYPTQKVIWKLFIFFAPFLGLILYYLVAVRKD